LRFVEAFSNRHAISDRRKQVFFLSYRWSSIGNGNSVLDGATVTEQNTITATEPLRIKKGPTPIIMQVNIEKGAKIY
jgi:hypothetical protein